MSLGTILLVVLILMLVGVLPLWPHASSWGYGPSGILGVVLVVVVVLFLMGRLLIVSRRAWTLKGDRRDYTRPFALSVSSATLNACCVAPGKPQ